MDTESRSRDDQGSIRALTRGLQVLRAINRHRSLNMMEIARLCKLPYPTTCRIVDTLITEGVIERETTRKHYRPTVQVRLLSSGYGSDDQLAEIARPHIRELTRTLSWPISICRRVGMSMMICDSTHAVAPYTLNVYHPGYTMPILGSSSGKVFLAFSHEEECMAILKQVRELNPARAEHILSMMTTELAAIRERGYGTYDRLRHTANPGKTSGISFPLMSQGSILGTLTLAFFCSTFTMANAIKLLVPDMRRRVAMIERDLLSPPPEPLNRP